MKDQPVKENPTSTPAGTPVYGTPIQPQPPVQEWQQTPPQPVQVQYVVAQKSLDGIGGWLAFWLVVFCINAAIYTNAFFVLLGKGVNTPAETTLAIFAPILAAAYLTSVVLISLRKKLGIYASMASIGLATVYSIVSAIIASSDKGSSNTTTGVIMQLMFGGFFILYFYTSKRIKATLRDK